MSRPSAAAGTGGGGRWGGGSPPAEGLSCVAAQLGAGPGKFWGRMPPHGAGAAPPVQGPSCKARQGKARKQEEACAARLCTAPRPAACPCATVPLLRLCCASAVPLLLRRAPHALHTPMMSSGRIHTASQALASRVLMGRRKISRPGGYMLSGCPMRALRGQQAAGRWAALEARASGCRAPALGCRPERQLKQALSGGTRQQAWMRPPGGRVWRPAAACVALPQTN